MKIEGYAKEIADFFALGYYSDDYFKIEVKKVPNKYNNGDATTAAKFPSDPTKHGEDCRPWDKTLSEAAAKHEIKAGCIHGSPYGMVVIGLEHDPRGTAIKKRYSGTNKVFCPHCEKIVRQGNFCEYCGGKLVENCDCWVLGKTYNCGLPKCPSLQLLTNPKLKALLHQPQNDKKPV